jgi:hypothetical protein
VIRFAALDEAPNQLRSRLLQGQAGHGTQGVTVFQYWEDAHPEHNPEHNNVGYTGDRERERERERGDGGGKR